ncbi:hypothetical protein WA158_002344 [Blastocystis sp. Blastoise]
MDKQFATAPSVNRPQRFGFNKTQPENQVSSSFDDIELDLKDADTKIKELSQMSQGLGSKTDNRVLRNELEKSIRDLDNMFNKMDNQLNELEKSTRANPNKSEVRENLKTISNLRRSRERYISMFKDHKDRINEYMHDNAPQLPAIYLDPQAVEESFNKVNNNNEANLQYNELLIRERHEDISKITSELQEVNIAFRDLAQIVNDQGEMVNTLENNTEKASQNTQQGVRTLLTASQYQNKTNKKCRNLILLIVLIFVIIVAIIVTLKLIF